MKQRKRSNPVKRCDWARTDLSIAYHDHEWGVPVHDDGALFEFLILEGAQAGLSWETILKKRDAYRTAFDHFDPERVARYNSRKIASLLNNPGIIRNRLKITAAITNARCFLKVQEQYGSFDGFIWRFAGRDGRPVIHRFRTMADVPAMTRESDAMSKALRQLGFKFVGSTICYAFMQATGMVNDHLVSCFRHAPCAKLRTKPRHGHASAL